MINIVNHVLNTKAEVISNEYKENHKALDIVNNDHTEKDIIALESGIVETVVKNIEGTNHNSKGLSTYGNYIKIKQTNGKTALYAHLKYGSINLNIGDFVEKGAIIGTMGETGNAYGKHLHLEIKNENGLNENPLISLNTPLENETEVKTEENIKEVHEEVKKEEVVQEEITKDTAKTENFKEVLTTKKEEYIKNPNKNTSIVDALKQINVDSSYNYRKKLATLNGIENYHGSYEQNIKLLSLLKEGTLKKV